MATPAEALYLWDWQADGIVLQTTGDPDIPFIHVASLRDRWYGVDWNLSQPYAYVVFDPVARTQTLLGGPTNSGDEYGNGNWIQHPADLDDQWALFSHFEGLAPSGSGWLAPAGWYTLRPTGSGGCWAIRTPPSRRPPITRLRRSCGSRRTAAT